jgi:hypothetical protein
MARDQKAQHVDGRDVVLDLNPLVKTVDHHLVYYSESSSYKFYVEDIVDRIVNVVLGMVVGVKVCLGR